jgi:spermidine/putrescine-binding protein
MNTMQRRAATHRRAVPAGLALVLVLAACGGDDDAQPTADAGDSGTSADAGESDLDTVDCAVDETDGDLALYNWSEYIDPDLISAFEDQYGVTVTEDFYDSNEAMQPIISAGGSGFDVIVPSDYMVSILIEGEDIMPLDKAAIPNYSNLLPEFESGLPYDPEGAYVAPYQWGSTGLGVNLTELGADFPRSWGLIFDPDVRAEYGLDGKLSLLNDPRETMGAALKYLGYSLDTTSEDELDEARDLLRDTVSSLAAFDSDSYDENLANGTTVVAHGYSGNFFAQFIDSDDPSMWDYFMPEEGGTQWVDNMAVVADAPHPCTAHAFINFLLDADNGAALSNWNYYASPNEASQPMIDDAVKPFLDKATAGVDPALIEFITDTGDFEINFSDAFAEARG